MKQCLFLVMVLPAALAQAPADLDKQCAEMRARAREEGGAFRESGGKPGSPGDPALRWAAAFWKFREAHSGTTAATTATGLALAWLRHAYRDREVLARAESLPAGDKVWTTAVAGVRDAARKAGQFDRFSRLAKNFLDRSNDTATRAAVYAAIGQSWLDHGQPERAREAFESAIRECPRSAAAKTAEKKL